MCPMYYVVSILILILQKVYISLGLATYFINNLFSVCQAASYLNQGATFIVTNMDETLPLGWQDFDIFFNF